jgi:hypothetical protein
MAGGASILPVVLVQVAVGQRPALITRRRALLALGGAAVGLAGGGDARRRAGPSPGAIGLDPLPMNLHPLGDRFTGLQRAALRTLATPWIRLTLGLVTQTTATRAYVGAAPHLLGLVSDFHLRTVEPATWPGLVEAVLRRYPEVRAAELLNEPEQFFGLSPTRYVQEFLRPGFERIRERFPDVAVLAAAPIGNRRKGLDYFRRMTDAGADRFCDYRAVHVYFDDESVLAAFARATARSIVVTETGIAVPGQHVRWYTEVIPLIREVLGARLVFWYVLLESAALAGGPVPPNYLATSLIAAEPDDAGEPRAAAGSALYPLLVAARSRVPASRTTTPALPPLS